MEARVALVRWGPLFALGLFACGSSPPEPSRPAPSTEPVASVRTAFAALTAEGPPADEAPTARGPTQLECPPLASAGCTLVVKVSIDKGAVEAQLVDSGRPGPIAVANGQVFFVGSVSFSSVVAFPSTVRDFAERDAAMRVVEWPGGRVRDMRISGDDLVIAEETATYLVSASKAKTVRTLAKGSGFRVALGKGMAIWAAGAAIVGAPLNGGPMKTLARDEDSPQDVAVDASGISWVNWGEGYGPRKGSVRYLADGASGPRTIATDQMAPRALTMSGSEVYWVVDGPKGRALRAVGRDGGKVRELVAASGREGSRANGDDVIVAGDWILFNAGDAIHRVRADGSEHGIVIKSGANGDLSRFVVDGGSIWVGATLFPPPPAQPEFDEALPRAR